MTGPGRKTVVIPMWGGGTLLLHCPGWCAGHPDVVTHPSDVAHESVPIAFEALGEELLHAHLSVSPFRTGDGGGRPVAVVRLPYRHHEMGVRELREFADSLADYRERLHTLADRLVELQQGDEQ